MNIQKINSNNVTKNQNAAFGNGFITLAVKNLGNEINQNVVGQFNKGTWVEIVQGLEKEAEALFRKINPAKDAFIKSRQDLVDKVDYFALAGGSGSRFVPLATEVGSATGRSYNKISLPIALENGSNLHMLDFAMGMGKYFTQNSGYEAKIAKGTYYYYFESKEATLEKVIEMMIEEECKKANEILQSNLSVQEKILGIIISMRPNTEELKIQEAINIPENIVMHQKINKKIIEVITPLLTEVIEEGKKQNIFDCDNVKERIEIILIITNNLFDANEQNSRKLNIYIEIFIDLIEKLLGAKKGTIDFAKNLIN